LVIEFWVVDLDFIWINPDNRAVYLMEVIKFVPILTTRSLEDVVVSLIPICNCSELRTGNSGQRMKVKAIEYERD
jgi:hypothetical protein